MYCCDYKVIGVLITYQPYLKNFTKILNSITSQVFKLVIIDNASDNYLKLSEIIGGYSNIEFVSLSENIGLASAQNKGISMAKNLDATHVVFFDQDSMLNDGLVDELIRAENKLINQGVKVAAVGPLFYDPDTKITFPATVFSGPFIKKIFINDQPVNATFIIASGCMVRCCILDKVGYMRDELFIDYIDVEWCLRAKSLGYSVYISPNTQMAHSIGDGRLSLFGRTISVHSAMRRYFLVRNIFFMLRLPYVPFGYKLRESIFNVLRCIIGIISSDNKFVYLKYVVQALHDGAVGQFGPCQKKYK